MLLREHRQRLGWSIQDLEAARKAADARKLKEQQAGATADDAIPTEGAAETSSASSEGRRALSSKGRVRRQTLADIAGGEVEDNAAAAAELSRGGSGTTEVSAASTVDDSLLLGKMRVHHQVCFMPWIPPHCR